MRRTAVLAFAGALIIPAGSAAGRGAEMPQAMVQLQVDATQPQFLAPPGCEDDPCLCTGGDPVYLVPYVIPNYSGWQSAKRLWTYQGGGTNQMRFFQYGSSKYELIKCGDGTCTETFRMVADGFFVTSEMKIAGGGGRVFLGRGLYFIPSFVCPNLRTFRMCHQGEQYVRETSCLVDRQVPSHCAIYTSRIDFAPGWNYGYNVGVVDSIIKIDKLDNQEVEKYWYGLNKGLLRWEHWSAGGQLLGWAQQTGEIPNSPIPHNSCLRP